MTQWIQLKVSLDLKDPNLTEWVSYQLFEAGAQGVDLNYAYDYLEGHDNLFGEIPLEVKDTDRQHSVELLAYFEDPDQAQVEKQVQSQVDQTQLHFTWTQVQEENWQEKWMAFYQPEFISRYLVIVPDWMRYSLDLKADQIPIFLDPGVAFGTGNHPTTQLGGQALEIFMRGGERVLDVGTGSGILAFIAASLGASQVAGFDLDPQAVASAQANLTLQNHNSLIQDLEAQGKIRFAVNDLLAGVDQRTDIIVANILPHILVNLFDQAYPLLTDQGYLILGGILEEKADFVIQAMDQHGFKLVQRTDLKGWVGLVAQKKEEA